MRRSGFTLIELLVAVAILGAMVALLLPALQAARESSRAATCGNNLRQIGVAVSLHHDHVGHFPFGGWGHEWVGLPDRGVAERQPGGWIYNTLPYAEQAPLHQLGDATSSGAMSRRLATPLSLFVCPSRRPCQAWPVSPIYDYMRHPRPTGTADIVARSDYAINAGSTLAFSFNGPASIALGDDRGFVWPPMSGPKPQFTFNGISHLRIGTRLRSIEDGASNTYLVGEKYLDPSQYENGESLGDNESLYSGYCSDNHRFTESDLAPAQDGTLPIANPRHNLSFGSPHPGGVCFVYCDGSVQLVAYDISPAIHRSAGDTSDGG